MHKRQRILHRQASAEVLLHTQAFQERPLPCEHKNYFNEKNHNCTKYQTLPDGYCLSIDHSRISFRKLYALRTKVERYNAHFKQIRQEAREFVPTVL